MARLALSLLGPLQVLVDGEPAVGFTTAKVRGLLAYLAVEAGYPHTREALAALLWPDWPGRHALSNLRQALTNLRATIHDRSPDNAQSLLLVSRETIQFNRASDHTLDVTAFEQAMQRAGSGEEARIAALAANVALYRGPFLDGLSIDSAPFEEWLTIQREHWQREALAALQELAELYERHGAYDQAQGCGRRALALEPTDEPWHRQMMRSFALGGERSAALAQYETCRRILDEELGVAPAPETTALFERIRGGALVVTAQAAAGPTDGPFPQTALGPRVTESPRPPFVAREQELAQLEQWLGEALRGHGRIGFVVGEPGSGKTTLMNEFAQQAMEAHPDLVTAGGNCNAYTGIGDPYLPFVEVLAMLSGDREVRPAGGAITEKHGRRLDALLPATLQALIETGPILIDVMVSGASLLTRTERLLPDGRTRRARAEEALRHRGSQVLQQTDLFSQYSKVLQSLSRDHPMLVILDDLQWADTGSIGLLFHLGRRLAGSRILVLGAYRTEEVALGRDGEQHPLEPVVNEFQRIWGDIRIDLSEAEGRRMVEEIIDSQPNRLGPGFREALYRHTGGLALFTVEMLRGLQERGDLQRDEAGRWVEGTSLDWAAFPNRIESVIAQQLGRLPPEWRELLATASVEGEEFTAEVVARVQGVDEHTVAHALNGTLGKQYHLVNAQSTRLMGSQHLSRYRFRHHLFQHYLYQGLNAVERAHLHEEMGNSLEALYGATPEFLYEGARLMAEDRFSELYGSRAVEVASIVPQLAWHYDAAGLVDKAVAYLSQAAFSAARSFAPKVALPHITRGVELLQSLPFTPELARREMSFEEMLGLMRGLTMGFTVAGARQAIERVCELARRAGDDANLVWGLLGLSQYYQSRGEYHTALELAEEMLALIPRAAPDLLPDAHYLLGEGVWATMGDFAKARTYLDPLFWPTPGRGALRAWPKRVPLKGFQISMTYWCTGWPDLSLRLVEMFLPLAPPGWRTFFNMPCVIMHYVRREVRDVLQGVQAMLPKTTDEHAGAHSPATLFLLGWAHAHLGQPEEGVSEMRQALDIWKQRGSGVHRSSWLAGLARGHALAGQPEEGLKVIAEAFEWLESKDERVCEAELHRLRGELLLQRGDAPPHAEDCFRQAIAIAQRQGAKSWELRATTSLARLLRDQGRRDEARKMLAAIYNWFTEGFDTPDLMDARALLQELA